ncbi:ECF transporter S component [Clostridium tyrobutyricum]|uniref:ECF transporter S component n=1 Tax=Clostridium tyrobutyricum TaxID=1519 RepID=UPI001C387066|nr:ECF transporter S component [Clostridium tyrobutyricum]MBV4419891.1 ECF transporter S component [Clostridium tyrobutyricum]
MEKQIKFWPKLTVKQLTVIGMLSAISIVLGVTGLGFIPIPPVKATIMHIPVIIGAILEGPLVGALVGLIFGVFSIIQSITSPTPISFVFMNPIVSVLPRICIGIASYYVYYLIKKRKKSVSIPIAAAIGSIINTVGVLGFIFVIYVTPYAKALNISVSAAKKGIITVGAINGIPEAILSVIITTAVVSAVTRIRRR